MVGDDEGSKEEMRHPRAVLVQAQPAAAHPAPALPPAAPVAQPVVGLGRATRLVHSASPAAAGAAVSASPAADDDGDGGGDGSGGSLPDGEERTPRPPSLCSAADTFGSGVPVVSDSRTVRPVRDGARMADRIVGESQSCMVDATGATGSSAHRADLAVAAGVVGVPPFAGRGSMLTPSLLQQQQQVMRASKM